MKRYVPLFLLSMFIVIGTITSGGSETVAGSEPYDVTVSAEKTPTVPVKPLINTGNSPKVPTTVKPRPTTVKPRPTTVKPAPQTLTLYPTMNGSASDTETAQDMVDTGALVTWTTSPTCILAGHDNMGWAFLNSIPQGTKVVVRTGPCAGTYLVFGHKWQSVKGGAYPSWMSDPNLDLVLQSCTGSTGMGFSLARKISDY